MPVEGHDPAIGGIDMATLLSFRTVGKPEII